MSKKTIQSEENINIVSDIIMSYQVSNEDKEFLTNFNIVGARKTFTDMLQHWTLLYISSCNNEKKLHPNELQVTAEEIKGAVTFMNMILNAAQKQQNKK